MDEGLARVIAWGSIALTVGSLALAVVFIRRSSRIRPAFDVVRSAFAVLGVLVMAAVSHVVTPFLAIVLAAAVGLGLGVAQGATLQVSRGPLGLSARRSPIGVALWGAGVLLTQVAGIVSRSGTVRVGQTIAWFGAFVGIGLLVGRTGQMRAARGPLVASGTAALLALFVAPTLLLGDTAAPAAALRMAVTGEDICEFVPTGRPREPWVPPRSGQSTLPLVPVEGVIAGCRSWGDYWSTGQPVAFDVYLLLSAAEARRVYDREAVANAEWYDSWATGHPFDPDYDPTLDYNLGTLNNYDVEGLWWSVGGAEGRVLVISEDFVLYGVADNLGFQLGAKGPDGYREPITLIEELITPMVETVRAVERASAPGGGTDTPVDPSPGDLAGAQTGADDGADEASEPRTPARDGGDDDRMTPEQAAAQAVVGLGAAGAIGLVTLVEVAAGTAGSRGSGGGGSVPRPRTPGSPAGPGGPGGSGSSGTGGTPFIDPYDGRALPVDPGTGMVFWPWDGRGGHWMQPAQVPALLDEWGRELDAENARRISAHEAQRERNWADLTDRIARSQQEEAARRAAEQARLADFDRRVAAARGWLEESDPDGLGQVDRITRKVADQGFATDRDLDAARRIADRARVWVAERAAWDAADWARIEGNRAAVIEIAAKGAAMIIDPTKGLASGFIFGATESWDRGDAMAAVVGNGVLDAATLRGAHAIGTLPVGQAALGKVGWGALSEAATAGGDALLRGATLEEAWSGAQTGFVFGGLGGLADEAVTAATRPRAETPAIRTKPGGSRVGYDHPTSPRHVDPGDPRYVAPGTPASEVPSGPSDWSRPITPFEEQPGPLGGRPPSTPPPPIQGIDAGDMPLPPFDAPSSTGGSAAPAATPESLLAGARPTRPSAAILDDMMTQPRHTAAPDASPVPRGAPDWQRGFFPDAQGRTLIDADGRVVVGDRQIGAVDPATGTLRNLDGQPVRVAADYRGVPVGYVEQPSAPAGMLPAYNERGQFAGFVDELGRADVGGRRVPVALDPDGRLVPYERPPIPAQAVSATEPRIPVLDRSGGVAHLVEAGPREIRYDRNGQPFFIQRRHPVQPSTMRDIVVDPALAPAELGRMPTPEVFDATEAWCPLTGEGAPRPAPEVLPTPRGSDHP